MKRLQIIFLALFTSVINMSFLMPIQATQADINFPSTLVNTLSQASNPCYSSNLIGSTGTSNAAPTPSDTSGSITGGIVNIINSGINTPTPTPTATTAVTCTPYQSTGALASCGIDPTQSGVLIKNPIVGAAGNMGVFTCYVSIVLVQNFPFIMLLATMLIIASGIAYMLSGGSSGELTKAKQRIGGILSGVALYFLIRFLIPILANGLTF